MKGFLLTRSWRKILFAIVALFATTIAVAGWYWVHFSMSAARPFEVNDPRSSPRVLIATQGSEFKDAVVAEVVEQLKARAAYVKVIDVSALPGVNETEWNAVALLHTWEMRKPPVEVKAFVDRARSSGKLVVLTTSGAGDFKIDGVDAISSASIVADAPSRAEEILLKLDAILAGTPANEQSPHPRIVDGRSISGQFAADLRGALERAIEEQGPVAAIAICRDEAPRIAAELTQKYGATVSRTSLKVRNARNAPLPWQRAGLELFERKLADGAIIDGLEHFEFQADGSARYMKAIVTAPLCTLCHGESLSPEIHGALREHYPEDRATGFKPGDLRGAFSVEWPAATAVVLK